VHKTVPIAEGKCYVDLNSKGSPLGFEMIAPGCLELKLNKNNLKPEIKKAFQEVRRTVKEIGGFVAV
jgi:hypothetical protein